MATNDDPRIERLLDLLEKDRQHVMLYVAVCFGIPALSLSALKFDAIGIGPRALLVLSLAGFVCAGVLYFWYAQQLHWMRLGGIDAIMDSDAKALRSVLFDPNTGPWARYGHLYLRGQSVLLAAAVAYVGFFVWYALAGVFSHAP